MMRAVSRCGRLLVIALLTSAAVAASAQAVVINPPGTAFEGIAENPTLTYGEQVITCATGTVNGTTSDPASDFVDVDVAFGAPCSIQPLNLGATVTCNVGEFTRWRALDPVNDTGEIDELLPGFGCDVVVTGVCTLEVPDQDLPVPGGPNRADLVFGTIEVEVDLLVTNNNSLCGPTPDAVGLFSAVYELDAPIEFD
jgi:hypothetical protein